MLVLLSVLPFACAGGTAPPPAVTTQAEVREVNDSIEGQIQSLDARLEDTEAGLVELRERVLTLQGPAAAARVEAERTQAELAAAEQIEVERARQAAAAAAALVAAQQQAEIENAAMRTAVQTAQPLTN